MYSISEFIFITHPSHQTSFMYNDYKNNEKNSSEYPAQNQFRKYHFPKFSYRIKEVSHCPRLHKFYRTVNYHQQQHIGPAFPCK